MFLRLKDYDKNETIPFKSKTEHVLQTANVPVRRLAGGTATPPNSAIKHVPYNKDDVCCCEREICILCEYTNKAKRFSRQKCNTVSVHAQRAMDANFHLIELQKTLLPF